MKDLIQNALFYNDTMPWPSYSYYCHSVGQLAAVATIYGCRNAYWPTGSYSSVYGYRIIGQQVYLWLRLKAVVVLANRELLITVALIVSRLFTVAVVVMLLA